MQLRSSDTDPHRLMTTQELAEFLKVSPSYLNKDRLTGRGIPFVKIGASVRYRLSDVLRFTEGRVRRSTSHASTAR